MAHHDTEDPSASYGGSHISEAILEGLLHDNKDEHADKLLGNKLKF